MNSPFIVLGAIAALGLLYVVTPVMLHAFMPYRKVRTLLCPEKSTDANVAIDAPRAAITAARGITQLRVRNCSYWPEKRGCAQSCLDRLR